MKYGVEAYRLVVFGSCLNKKIIFTYGRVQLSVLVLEKSLDRMLCLEIFSCIVPLMRRMGRLDLLL